MSNPAVQPICPMCAEDIESEAPRCIHCSHQLIEPDEPAERATKTDKQEETPSNTKTVLDEDKPDSPPSENATSNSEGEVDSKGTTEEPQTKLCPSCAEEIKFSAKKCKHCGDVLESIPRSIHEIRHNLTNFAKTEVSSCFKCGYSGPMGVFQKARPWHETLWAISLSYLVHKWVGRIAGITALVLLIIFGSNSKTIYHCPYCDTDSE